MGDMGVTEEYPDPLYPIPHSSLFMFVNITSWGGGCAVM